MATRVPCKGVTVKGEPCKRMVDPAVGYCFSHLNQKKDNVTTRPKSPVKTTPIQRPKSPERPPAPLLPGDALRLIAMVKGLNTRDIINLCKVNKTYNAAICNNRRFWEDRFREEIVDDDTVLGGMTLPEIREQLGNADDIEVSTDRKLLKDNIFLAAHAGYDKLLMRLLDNENGPTNGAGLALVEATKEGYIDIIKAMIESHHMDDNYVTSALFLAAKNNHREILELLLPYIPKENIQLVSLMQGDPQIIQILRDYLAKNP